MEATKEGRNINRHYYTTEEIDQEVQRPVVQRLFDLLKLRNRSAAFDLDGVIEVATPSNEEIQITRRSQDGQTTAVLTANLKTKEFSVSENEQVVLEQLEK